MKTRNILSKATLKLTVIASCTVLLVGLGAFSALDAKATPGKNDKLNIEQATSIALEDAKLKETEVTKVKGTSETDDGKLKYEIKFNADGIEYEYEINAKTGAIIDKSVEKEEVKKVVSVTPVQEEAQSNNTESNETSSNKLSVVKPEVNTANANQATTITAAQAKSIALKDAKASDNSTVIVKLDKDDGISYYDVEFVANGYEYDYEISAKSGAILDKSVEKEEVRKPSTQTQATTKPNNTITEKPTTNTANTNQATTITAAQAKSIALKDAKASDNSTVIVKLDKDGGISYYDVEFVANGYEYDYEISAKSGAILDKSVEKEEVRKPSTQTQATTKPENNTTNQVDNITVDQAKSIALKDANVTNATFVKANLDRDDGISFYEVEFLANGYEYEYEVDAKTGKILDKSFDREDD